MSFPRSLFRRFFRPDATDTPARETAGPAAAPDAAASPTTKSHDGVARLAALGTPEGPSVDEALGLLATLRTTRHEAAALDALRTLPGPLPEPLRVATARAYADRGDSASARRLLEGATSEAAWLFAADLAEEAGEPNLALSLVERVLARAYATPGATERHDRLAAQLGRRGRAPAATSGETTVLSASVESPFLLRREIARGGAAAVYEAEDRDLGRRVALKVYHDGRRDRSQLLHEARVANKLARSRIVRVFDVDPEAGWLALELCAEGSLRERLRPEGPPVSAEEALGWLAALAATLAAVHEAGYVHLDVKPGNVLLRGDDIVLTDFGTARRVGEASPAGSLGYVAPERLAGAAASPGDDVYGFGRIVEDTLRRVDRPLAESAHGRVVDLAGRCLGPMAGRPTTSALAEELVRLATR